jgi:hypothetical protein
MSSRMTFVTSDAILTHGLRSRAWIVGCLLGLLVGVGLHVTKPPTYTATAAVELTKIAPSLDLSPIAPPADFLTVDTDAQMVETDEVISAVAKAAGQSTAQVRTSLAVSARQLTRVLLISYTTSSADDAVKGAQQAAETFLAERQKLIVEPLQDYLAEVRSLTASPKLSVETTTQDLTGKAQSRVEGFRQRAMNARLQISGAGTILQAARVSSAANRGNPEIPIVTGLCTGGLLGLGFGLALHYRRRARLARRQRVSEPAAS